MKLKKLQAARAQWLEKQEAQQRHPATPVQTPGKNEEKTKTTLADTTSFRDLFGGLNVHM